MLVCFVQLLHNSCNLLTERAGRSLIECSLCERYIVAGVIELAIQNFDSAAGMLALFHGRELFNPLLPEFGRVAFPFAALQSRDSIFRKLPI